MKVARVKLLEKEKIGRVSKLHISLKLNTLHEKQKVNLGAYIVNELTTYEHEIGVEKTWAV